MNTASSSKWIVFSDYEIKLSEDGTKYVRPVPGSAHVIYDPMLKPQKLAVAVLDAIDSIKKDRSDEKAILDLVRCTGLPGFAAVSDAEYVFPFGGEAASGNDLLLAGRGSEYGFVFSEDYSEKYDDICRWLENIEDSLTEKPDFTNLKSIAGYCICTLSEAGKLHRCPICKKNYFSEDAESKACSKTCEFQLLLKDKEACIDKGYYCHFFSRPRVYNKINKTAK